METTIHGHIQDGGYISPYSLETSSSEAGDACAHRRGGVPKGPFPSPSPTEFKGEVGGFFSLFLFPPPHPACPMEGGKHRSPRRRQDHKGMAGSEASRFLYELPAAVMCKFCQLMDALGRADWERFGEWRELEKGDQHQGGEGRGRI